MAGSTKDRSSRVRSFFENDIFLDELKKIKEHAEESEEDDNLDIEVIKLRKHWKLNWDYHETIIHYLETGEVDYSLGDPDIRIVDYKAKALLPSDAPHDEFRIMDSLKDTKNTGVHIKLPKDINKTALLNFIKDNYDLIEASLDNNFKGRLFHQAPEQQTKRKVHIFRLYQQGMPVAEIAKLKGDDPRVIRHIIKEYKEKISA